MANIEIPLRIGNPIRWLWWKFMPGTEIVVPTPATVWVTVTTIAGAYYSGDPNEVYRPDLERYVGKQGRDWDWRLKDQTSEFPLPEHLIIKIRRGKEKWATQFLLKWAQ